MTRPGSRRASTAWAAGLAGVAALLVPPAPAQAGESPSPSVPQPTAPSTPEGEPDPTTTPREPLRVEIDRLTPGEVPERGAVRVAGTVRNRSDEPWRNLQVYFLRSTEPITDVAALTAAAAGSCVDVGTRVIDPFVEVPDLDPGESSRFRLEVPRGALELSGAPGVYEVGVHVLGESVEGRVEGADGRSCTFLPLVPDGAGTTLALGIQLRNHTIRAPDGALEFLRGWEQTFSSGRLRRLVELGSSAGGRPLTWVVDPALVDAAVSVARGNPAVGLAPPRGGGEDGPDQGSGEGGDGAGEDPPAGDDPPEEPQETPDQAAASDWLTTVTDELATSPVMALPYGDLDAAAVVRRGLPEQLAIAQAASTAVLEERDVSSKPALVPLSGLLPGEALAELTPTTTVVLQTEALPDTVTVPVVERRDGGRLLVVPPREAIWGPGPSARRSALAVRQRLLADAALHALSGEREPLVRLLPAGWDPGPAWRRARFFRALDVPWLAAGGLAQAASAPLAGGVDPVGPRELAYPDAEAAAELPFAAVSSSARLAESGRTLEQLLTENDVVDQTFTRQGLLAASLWSRRRPGLAAERADAADERVDRWLSRISVRGPSFVTMSGDAGTFDVTVVNGLDEPVAVGLDATVPTGRLSLSTPGAVELPPRGRAAMRIDATATDIGIHLVTLQPVTADGVEVGEVTTLSIRSSRVGLILWIVMGAAGALLFVLVAVRIVRRVRQRRRTHGPLLKAGAR